MNFAWRIYRLLAQAFPHEFKLAYGTDVLQLGEDSIKDIAKRHGTAGLIRLIADIADPRAARIPQRNARRHALCHASVNQIAGVRARRHHFDGT